MSERAISVTLRRLIIERAGNRCEYCLLPADVAYFPHEVDHIVAIKHGGTTEEANLAFACWRCNRHKGSDLGSFDPLTQAFSFLFNPRTQVWAEHFMLQGAQLASRTPEGRTTIQLLHLNSEERVAEHLLLIERGQYLPPSSDT